nr:cobalt ECF transporter T component CbiQ [Gordonia sp. SID5947]
MYRAGVSPVHRAPVEAKLVCLVIFVFAVVATPREMFWPYAVYTAAIVAIWCIARLPVRWVLPRMLIELPFVVLAVLLPFSEGGERVPICGLSLSVPGLFAAWGILVKGTLGVAASVTFAATTPANELPIGLGRLGIPRTIAQILVMMLRYVDLLSAEARRGRIARESRGDSPRALHQAAATATGVGALFLRSYERGERVHVAMLSRGFDGRMPEMPEMPGIATVRSATWRWWLGTTSPALIAVAVAVCARVVAT